MTASSTPVDARVDDTAPVGTARPRWRALDVLRGLTVAAMLLVNNPGSSDAVYAPLEHAAWNGWTPTDLIFPFFLFVVGITTELSLSARAARGETDAAIRRQILRRGALIFLVGVLLNWFPLFRFGRIGGIPSPTLADRVVEPLLHLRFLGVLQRIGLAYVAAALLAWRAPARRVAVYAAVILLGYWAAMSIVPVPAESTSVMAALDYRSRNLSAWVDRATLDWRRWGLGNHIWDYTATFDPEGLLSTVPAVATVLLGVLAGRWLARGRASPARLTRLLAVGVLGAVIGLAWDLAFPINKNLWSSSYVLLTAGLACVALAVLAWIAEARGAQRWTTPLVVYGANPIVAFVGSELMARLLQSTIKVRMAGRLAPAREWVYARAFASWLEPRAASLAYALCFVLVWYLILAALHRRRVYLKI